METRSARVMVKLGARTPDEVLFTEGERERVVEAAVKAGFPHVSTFIRELALDGALANIDKSRTTTPDREWVRRAAKACGMPLGRWLREVVLGAIGLEPEDAPTPLPQHQKDAGRWFKKRAA